MNKVQKGTVMVIQYPLAKDNPNRIVKWTCTGFCDGGVRWKWMEVEGKNAGSPIGHGKAWSTFDMMNNPATLDSEGINILSVTHPDILDKELFKI